MGLIRKLKSKFQTNTLTDVNDITNYSNVDEVEQCYIVGLNSDLWLKVADDGPLTFARDVHYATSFRFESRARDMADYVQGHVVRIVVVHYYDAV